jgi:Flp pilus assembly protein TadG
MRAIRRIRTVFTKTSDQEEGGTPMTDRTDNRERGAALPFVSIALVLLLGAAAFAVDLGGVHLNGNRIQKAADAAALAGVVHITNVKALALPHRQVARRPPTV